MTETQDILTPDPIVVTPDTTLGEAASRMLRHRIRHLPVVDEGRPIGVLTDVAVFRYGGMSGDEKLWVPFQEGELPTTAAEVLVAAAVVARPQDQATATLRRILASDQDFALVVDEEGLLMGIITEHDGMRIAAQSLDESPLTTRMELHRPVIVARMGDSAREILVRMQDLGIRHMAVVAENLAIRGVLSVGDLLADNVMFGPDVRVRDVLRHKQPVTIGPDRPFAEAATKMMSQRVGCLPVVDSHGVPRGILTRTDLIEGAIAALEQGEAFDGA